MAQTTTRALIRLLLLAALPAAAAAQPPTPSGRLLTQPPPAAKGRLVDRMIGIFGDRAILESTIYSELQAYIEGARNADQPLTPEKIQGLRGEILRRMLEEEALAQGARTMRGTTREQVDQIVDEYVKDFVREEEQRAGSVNQLTQDLGILGQTWESLAEEKRRDGLAAMATQENLRRRYQDNFALAVTPAEMREFYRANLDMFVQEPSVDLEIITIPSAGDPEGARARAEQAAAAWREPGRSAAEVAALVGGHALSPHRGVRNTDADPHAAPIKMFVASAAEGEVSEPIAADSGRRNYWVLKAVALHAGRSDTFEDPRVQAFIQSRLVRARIESDNQKLIRRESDKLRIITPRGHDR